ncbi:MAG: glycosyltransferase, partial [Actinobacteria bacterium]|nr:glycosyltransferase [Actinomycetota bacterium]
ATTYGGGVSELLRSQVPLERALGLDSQWQVISGDEPFFRVTKAFHNALQGGAYHLTRADQETYLAYNSRNAQALAGEYDFVIVHDPQPAALRHLSSGIKARWIWRCHIDTSNPDPEVWEFLVPFINEYDTVIFTLREFVPPGLKIRVETILPAIDPLSPKNMELPGYMSQHLLNWIGVPKDGPLICQVSRFDPWKDPLGVIEAYRLIKGERPDVRLALVGSMALDDPEGWDIYNKIIEAERQERHIHVFTNLVGVGDVQVNAFQRLADVVIQKSIREGFGLVVSETLWKGTPVVARRAGGIPSQMAGGGGSLVESVEETAEKVLELLANPELAAEEGRRGKAYVHKNFLITRLIHDELKLLASMI